MAGGIGSSLATAPRVAAHDVAVLSAPLAQRLLAATMSSRRFSRTATPDTVEGRTRWITVETLEIATSVAYSSHHQQLYQFAGRAAASDRHVAPLAVAQA